MARLVLFSVMILGAVVSRPAAADPATPVTVHIVVIEASKKTQGFDPALEREGFATKIADFGYTGAKIMDELNTPVEPKANVQLEILGKSEQKRMLQVRVLDVKNDGSVKLRVAIPDFKFSTDTTHKKGGTILVVHKRGADAALFLAITPKL